MSPARASLGGDEGPKAQVEGLDGFTMQNWSADEKGLGIVKGGSSPVQSVSG